MAKKTSGLVDSRGRSLSSRMATAAARIEHENYTDGYLEVLPKGKLDDLPIPEFWSLLIQPLQVPTKSKGGIMLPADMIRNLEFIRDVAKIWRIGSLAFTDENKYGKGCATRIPFKVGGWIYFNKYAGTETRIHGVSFRLITEDDCFAHAASPESGAYRVQL